MPRNFKVGEVAVDLALNLLESQSEELQKAGIDITGLSLLPQAVRGVVSGFLEANASLLPFIETGFKALVFGTMPNLSAEQKLAIGSVLDTYTDGVRKAFSEEKDAKAEGMVSQASGQFRANLKKALDELAKKKSAKPPLNALLSKLSWEERHQFLLWVRWMEEHDQQSFKMWNELKERIATVEELRDLLRFQSGTHEVAATQERIAYLRMTYGKPATFAETLKAAARGEETPATRALRAQVEDTTNSLREMGDRSRARAQAIRDKYRR